MYRDKKKKCFMATAAETMFPSLCSSSTGTDHVITYLSFTRQQDEKRIISGKESDKKSKENRNVFLLM